MNPNIKILKVGGSVVTYKDKNSSLNLRVVENIARDIARWLKENKTKRLIFTSGAGSFGHPLAHKYQLNAETARKDALGFVLTTTNMLRMANRIARVLHDYNIPLFPIMSSSIFETDKGRITHSELDVLEKALDRGLVPFLWGDTVIDKSHTFRILSGDQINPYLVERLGVKRLYFGTNVDGVYDSDPARNPNAVHIDKINNRNYMSVLNSITESGTVDVTKGMRGKIEEIYQIKIRPLKCVIFNALLKESVYKALSDQEIGTQITFKDK